MALPCCVRVVGSHNVFFSLLFLCLVPQFAAKVTNGLVRLGSARNKWEYISKFGYDRGEGEWKFRVKLHKPSTIKEPVRVDFFCFIDEDWDAVLAEPELCKRNDKAKSRTTYLLKEDGSFNDYISKSVTQNVRPHIWYYVLSDCDGDFGNVTHRLKWEMEMLNPGGEHFSVEMHWMTTANVLNMVFFSIFLHVFYKLSRKFAISAGSLHPVIWFLLVGIIIQFVAQVFHTLHLVRYQSNGTGNKPLEVISEILFMMSQVCQTSLLILIGLGYTLLQSKLGDLDLMIPMCFMVAMIHVMLVAVGKVQDDAHYKYHENEGVIGWILLVMRLMLYLWFLWAVQSTAAEGGQRIQRFMKHFRIAGTLYFLSSPAMFLIVGLFAPYWQHMIMSCGLMIMQMASNIWLSQLFLTKGEYFKVSTLSDSDLPGGSKIGMVKEE